jgi:hypothetical protein
MGKHVVKLMATLHEGPRSRDKWIEAILLVESSKFVPRTLDEGPRSRDKWIEAILLVESFKFVPRTLDEGPRPKSGKLRLIWHLLWRENQIVRIKRSAKRRPPDLENQESGWGPRYTPSQGFNLLHMSPNWILGNWTLDPRLKWA